MKSGVLFLILGGVFVFQAARLGGGYWAILWPGISFWLVALGYLWLGPSVFGKRSTGAMAWHCALVLLPYLLLTWLSWHAMRLVSREDCYNEVMPGLFVGRRPLPGELPDNVSLVVDLTAEFPERWGVLKGREYITVPMLDTGVIAEDEFISLVRQIAAHPGAVYIHCAQGHGRTGTVAAAVLVAKGQCASAEDAVTRLRAIRPGLDLGKNQMAFLRRACGHQGFPPETTHSA